MLPLLYPKITFTTSKPDLDIQLETRQEMPAHPRWRFETITPLPYVLDVNPQQYSTMEYRQRGIALLHYHATIPKIQSLTGHEKARMIRFLEDKYGPNGGLSTPLRNHDFKVQKFSHCLSKHQVIRSRLAPQNYSTREAHNIAYCPRDEHGNKCEEGTWAFASVQYFCHITWREDTCLLGLIKRLSVGFEISYGNVNLIHKIADGPMEFIDVEQISD